MSQLKKLFDKAERNPNGLSFSEFQALMTQFGWIKDRQKGSHEIWYSPKKARVSIQKRAGMAKGYQVRQFLNLAKEETDGKVR